MTVPFMYNFRSSSLINSLKVSEVRLFFIGKRKPKIFGFKNVMERGNRKILTFVIRETAFKIFWKIRKKEALVISKRLKLP